MPQRIQTSARRGVTLMELLIVVALIGLLSAITFPAISAGLESIRLASATDSVVSFFNAGLNRAERRQQAVEITISQKERELSMRSTDPSFSKRIKLPDGISIGTVLPELPEDEGSPRRFLLYPGGAPPRIGIELANARKARRMVRIDPMTGVPRIERIEPK